MKHRIVHGVQKYLLNPPIKFLFAISIAPPGYALLETTGRKTGKPRRTPVGDGLIGSQFWIVAEHGMKAGYIRNIASNPRVRLKLRDGLRSLCYGSSRFFRFWVSSESRRFPWGTLSASLQSASCDSGLLSVRGGHFHEGTTKYLSQTRGCKEYAASSA